MSMLLIGIEGEIGRVLIRRLLAESDEVRVVEDDPAAAAQWSALGAHVARGSPIDPDLIERAAQNVRTVVVLQRADHQLPEVTAAVLQGARAAERTGGDIRIVLCGPDPQAGSRLLGASGMDHIVLRTSRRRARLLPIPGSGLDAAAVAEAIDAADDLSGNPRLDLDLSRAPDWSVLHLSPPQRG